MPDTSANKTPVVSVVIPTYNRAPLLRTAIECIQAQSFTNWELLVMDDGSTDDTRAVVENMAVRDKRIAYYHQAHRGFPAPGLNRSLSLARGAFLFKFDDDDTVHCDYLDKCVTALRTHADYSMVETGVILWGNRGAQWSTGHLPFFFRTSALRAVGGWSELYQAIEDGDLYDRLCQQGEQSYRIDDVLYHYWRHGAASLSGRPVVLLYHFMVVLGGLWRRWGLADFTPWGRSAAHMAPMCYGRSARMPYAMRKRVSHMARLDYIDYVPDSSNTALFMQPRHAWLYFLPIFRNLVAHQPRFPYHPLWQACTQLWQLMRAARYPILWRVPGLFHAARHYWSKTQRQACQSILHIMGGETQVSATPQIAILLIADGPLAELEAALKSITEQKFTDWELYIGLPHAAAQNVRQFVQRLGQRNRRVRFLPFTQALGHNAMLDILRQKTKAAYFCLHQLGATSHRTRLAQAIAYMEQHPKVVALCSSADTQPDVFRNHPALRLVSIFDGGRGWDAAYLNEHLRVCGLVRKRLAEALYDPKHKTPDAAALPWGAWRGLVFAMMDIFKHASLPDLFLQGCGVREALGVCVGARAFLPQHMQWRLPAPDTKWARLGLFWQNLLAIRHA